MFTHKETDMKLKTLALALTLSIGTQAAEFTYSENVTNDQMKAIDRDLNVLKNMKFKPASSRTLQVMGVNNLDSASASKWLNERVNYIIAEKDATIKRILLGLAIYTEKDFQIYPNPGSNPLDNINELTSGLEKAEAVTVMSNIGAGVYMLGKQQQKLYGLKVSRGLLKKQRRIPVTSPRVGIIQIGEGLFMKRFAINKNDDNAVSNSLSRLSTFFHEARHSDGNGASLGFAHAICPDNHPMAGNAACDTNLNGPYTVGALMTAELAKSCDSCSVAEVEELKMRALEEQSRVLPVDKKGTRSVDLDDRPERIQE